MGVWVHKVSNANQGTMLGDCAACGPGVKLIWKSQGASTGRWRLACNNGLTKQRRQGEKFRRRPYLRHKKDYCERCGLIPEDPILLDVDHINGRDIENPHDPSNLQTLCANCHRLKTIRPDLFLLPASLTFRT